MLGTGGNYDLLGIALNGACGPQVIADCPAKRGQAARIGIAKVIVTERTKDPRAEPPPQFHGARIHEGAPQIERSLIALYGHIDEVADWRCFHDTGSCDRDRTPSAFGLEPFDWLGKIRRYIGAGTDLAADKSFRQQLFVG